MSLMHNNQVFPGNYSTPVFTPVEAQFTRTKFQGVNGVSEINGGRGGRSITINLWVFDNYASAGAVEAALQAFNKRVGENGYLQLDGNLAPWLLRDVTFEGWDYTDPLQGPKPDVAGTLDGGWFADVNLHFTQLSIEDD